MIRLWNANVPMNLLFTWYSRESSPPSRVSKKNQTSMYFEINLFPLSLLILIRISFFFLLFSFHRCTNVRPFFSLIESHWTDTNHSTARWVHLSDFTRHHQRVIAYSSQRCKCQYPLQLPTYIWQLKIYLLAFCFDCKWSTSSRNQKKWMFGFYFDIFF